MSNVGDLERLRLASVQQTMRSEVDTGACIIAFPMFCSWTAEGFLRVLVLLRFRRLSRLNTLLHPPARHTAAETWYPRIDLLTNAEALEMEEKRLREVEAAAKRSGLTAMMRNTRPRRSTRVCLLCVCVCVCVCVCCIPVQVVMDVRLVV